MNQEIYARVRANPKFQLLVQKRSRLAWSLAAVMLGFYYTFILIIAFFPELFGMRLGEGVMTLGIPVGVGLILLAFVLTGIYVQRANGEFDTLTREIKEEARGEV
ncbi:MAG: DUF485 domain-containing protein [Campylobacterales bacterium]|nr:DUF485 domain-containing protein [Campylobacterales bacterium]